VKGWVSEAAEEDRDERGEGEDEGEETQVEDAAVHGEACAVDVLCVGECDDELSSGEE
jgi:hypothetical protein